MERPEYAMTKLSCRSLSKQREGSTPRSGVSQSEKCMPSAAKRRSSLTIRNDASEDGEPHLAYASSSLDYRAKKVRNGIEVHKDEAVVRCCQYEEVFKQAKKQTSPGAEGTSNASSTATTLEDIMKTSPYLCMAHAYEVAGQMIKKREKSDPKWPPNNLKVMANPEEFTELNFAEYRSIYDGIGPVMFESSLTQGLKSRMAELRMIRDPKSILISQNSTQRVVYNAYWLPKQFPKIAVKVAVKSVKDSNMRDGRSIKREIGCHLYIYQQLMGGINKLGVVSPILADDWPTSEILGYYLDKKNPGNSVLVTRKLFGPDFFDIIRSECSPRFSSKNTPLYELNKLDWCIIALERIAQISELGIRHNDIKPDNIVLDMYECRGTKRVDVKVIDLGAASMERTKEFTGGTSWYESPEQKVLEFYTKRHHNMKRAQTIEIDRASDAWGAGHSIIEVLLGRRMVDHVAPPRTKEAPELINPPQEVDEAASDPLWWNRDEYWTIPPEVWVKRIRTVLKLDDPVQKFPLCAKAARYVYDKLMHVDPRRRASVRSVAEGLRQMAHNENFGFGLESNEGISLGMLGEPMQHSGTSSAKTAKAPGPSMMPTEKVPEHVLHQLIMDLAIHEKREYALTELSKQRDHYPDLPVLLWYTFGTVATLIYEIVSVYHYLYPVNISMADSTKASNSLTLLQCIASHPQTRRPFLAAHIPLFLYPFLNSSCKSRRLEYLKLTCLGVIGSLVKSDDEEVITFLLETEIIALCLRIMESGSEISKTVAIFIVQKIMLDDRGLAYVCATAERFYAVAAVLNSMVLSLLENPSRRILKHVVRCYLRLSENPRAREMLCKCLPKPLRKIDPVFYPLLKEEPMLKKWLLQLICETEAMPDQSKPQ